VQIKKNFKKKYLGRTKLETRREGQECRSPWTLIHLHIAHICTNVSVTSLVSGNENNLRILSAYYVRKVPQKLNFSIV